MVVIDENTGSVLDEINEILDTIAAYVANRGTSPQAALTTANLVVGDAEDLVSLARQVRGMVAPDCGHSPWYFLAGDGDTRLRCCRCAFEAEREWLRKQILVLTGARTYLREKCGELRRDRDEARKWARRLYRAVLTLIGRLGC